MKRKLTLEILMQEIASGKRSWTQLTAEQRTTVQAEHARRREERVREIFKKNDQRHRALEHKYGCKIKFVANEHSAGNVGSMFFYPAFHGKYVLYAPGGDKVFPNRHKMLLAACKIQRLKRHKRHKW